LFLLPPGAITAQTTKAEFLSEHPEMLLARSQSWGELGINVAAHELHKTGEPLHIGTQSYTNGLGHHASGKLLVLLGSEFATFEAEVGPQPCAGGGSVRFRVQADGKKLFDSGIMHTGDPAKPVCVPVVGAQELVLEADDAGDGISCDLANWANARLVRTAGSRVAGLEAFDVARFGTVITSQANRIDGSNADRLEEYRAEDLFLNPELKANAEGIYTLTPNSQGIACIGLKWLSKRPLRELRLRLPKGTPIPLLDAVSVQGWVGESAWQGNWLALEGEKSIEGDELVIQLSSKAPKGGLLQTRMIRWLLPAAGKSVAVGEQKAYTRSRWDEVSVLVEAENPSAGARGQVRIFNGELLSSEGQSPVLAVGWSEWELSRPLRLKLKYSRPSSLKADATVLQFRLPTGGVGVAVEDLLPNRCVYVPSQGLYLALTDGETEPLSLADYQRSIVGRKSTLEEVRTLPDQTFAQAMAKTHRAAQDEGPVMLSLACDNTKFVVDRSGDVNFPVGVVTNNDWFASAGDLHAVFGDGKQDRLKRHLEGGWLPLPVITVEREGVRYTERVFVAPADADGANPTRLNRRSLCVVEFATENLRDQPTPARLELRFRLAGKTKPPAELVVEGNARISSRLGQLQARLVTEGARPLQSRAEGGTLTLAGDLPPRGSSRCVVFLGEQPEPSLNLADVPTARAATEKYWHAVLAPAMQIETPDELLNNVIRSSQVRCLIAARNEADGARIAPWIAAMAYGPLESEAHSVIRGMDFLGHQDFARRGLEYYIHRYNTNGFLTTGYTTFGTAWHIWTLAEHYELTGDQAWLRKHTSELRRVGDWILRQREKTKHTGPDDLPAPESGLMPPGVLADWNAFAYYFMMNGYYHAALKSLGTALASIGDTRASAYTRGAQELQQDILRAYRWTQAQSQVLPLRNGTWIPLYPSQVHSPGKLADFFPGDDAGRSWAYDTELGAHQLVPGGVFPPNDLEVTRMLDHMEDVQFLGEGWFDYPAVENAKDWFNLGGFAKVQPYYGRNAEIYAMRDEVKPFLRSYFNSLASLLNVEVLTLWEHFRHSGAWDKTHETGYFLHQTRTMLLQERGKDIWLAPFIPSEWLQSGKTLEVRNAPTQFGPVSFKLASGQDAGKVEVSITPPVRTRPEQLVVRLRHPKGRAIQSVQVDGREHRDYDAREQTIMLKPGPKPMTITVRYE
jgi:hypothetical protein